MTLAIPTIGAVLINKVERDAKPNAAKNKPNIAGVAYSMQLVWKTEDVLRRERKVGDFTKRTHNQVVSKIYSQVRWGRYSMKYSANSQTRLLDTRGPVSAIQKEKYALQERNAPTMN